MQRLFSIDSRHHGKSSLLSAWHPQSTYIASCGASRIVHICDRRGKIVEQITLPLPTACLHLEWDRTGDVLACLQEHSNDLLLWYLQPSQQRRLEIVELQLKEPSFIRWSKTHDKIAVGTARGELIIYDRGTREKCVAVAKHKKRISCGDWSSEGAGNRLAFSSDDRQITICTDDGLTFGQVKVKSKPTRLIFGGNARMNRDNIVSVSMDQKTILLYNLDDPENALELAFQPRYGSIVTFHWFRDGFIMVAFSLGYVVVISTHMADIGREQFCAQYHRDSLKDIAYCATRNKIATCGGNCVKIIDMSTWKEVHSEQIDKEAGLPEQVRWSPDGTLLSVSTKHGTLLGMAVLSSDSDVLGAFKDAHARVEGLQATSNSSAASGSASTAASKSKSIDQQLRRPFLTPSSCCVYSLIVFIAFIFILSSQMQSSLPALWRVLTNDESSTPF